MTLGISILMTLCFLGFLAALFAALCKHAPVLDGDAALPLEPRA